MIFPFTFQFSCLVIFKIKNVNFVGNMVLSFIIYMLMLYATDSNRAPNPDALSYTNRRLTVFKYIGVVCDCAEGREMLRIDESFFRRHENTPSSKMAFMCYETLLKSVDTFSMFLLSFLAEDGVVEQELDRIQIQKNIMKIKKQDEIKERIFESIRSRERRRQEQERIRLEQQVDLPT
ncbi:hypothetical protein THOM_2089 [Trachipleistophora hominis]|uniref:Uncharacterized protein n=1 Tax=Trachipleistophora hominis TaxID=72359 RepID=L7JU17_TRAHO|nr:hypothetical protein THOM_2089 [Trachipleistophora hominis]